MAIGKLWAGRTFGTNVGNLFLRLSGDDDNLAGTLHFSSSDSGVLIFELKGTFDGATLKLGGEPKTRDQASMAGALKVAVSPDPAGVLRGQWETASGAAGTLELYPHDVQPNRAEDAPPPQLFTTRHEFGAIGVDKCEIVAIAEAVQREFAAGKVTIAVTGGTEQVAFLDDFRKRKFNAARAKVVRIFVRESEQSGLDRVTTVEFGPHVNFVATQSGDEAWALGMREKLKAEISRFERFYATNFKKLNIGINQLLLVAAIVYLPSLAGLANRAILMTGVILIAAVVNLLHSRYLPHAQIYLSSRPEGLVSRIGPPVVSWLIAVTAGIAATLLAIYLQGWLHITAPAP